MHVTLLLAVTKDCLIQELGSNLSICIQTLVFEISTLRNNILKYNHKGKINSLVKLIVHFSCKSNILKFLAGGVGCTAVLQAQLNPTAASGGQTSAACVTCSAYENKRQTEGVGPQRATAVRDPAGHLLASRTLTVRLVRAPRALALTQL